MVRAVTGTLLPWLRLSLICAALAAALPADAQPRPASCDTVGKNLFVHDVMQELYYWYRELPNVDPTTFASPEEYLEAVRYLPLDHSFSYIADLESNEAFFSNSQFVGIGFSSRVTPAGELRVTEVYPDSPAARANVSRGDFIVEINGRSVPDALASGDLDALFGPPETGHSVDMVVRRGTQRFSARVAKDVVTIPTVSRTDVYTAGSRTVGYVFLRNFVEPTDAALDAAFTTLRQRNVNELVLDVRYNGGGLVEVAQHLASLIGGTRTSGQVFAEYFHNDKHPELNRTTRFDTREHALSLDRLVVITTDLSASASELIINALRPFIPVITVGSRTYGKPVGQYSIEFCDKVLAPVAFTLRNANGDGDFFDGFAPTCAADDDLDRPLGDAQEGSLREALAFIATGRCSGGRATTSARAPAERRATFARDAWRLLVGAR
jgi:C-terminal peptidase prc